MSSIAFSFIDRITAVPDPCTIMTICLLLVASHNLSFGAGTQVMHESIEQEDTNLCPAALHVNLIANDLETVADPLNFTSLSIAPPQSSQDSFWISDAHLEAIGRRFPNVRRLTLGEARITSAGLKLLTELTPKLEVLIFEGKTGIFPDEFEIFPLFSSLRSLRIECTNSPLSDFSFDNWDGWTSLECLDIGDPLILGGIGNVERLPNLKKLRVGGFAESPTILVDLAASSSLSILDIQYLRGTNDETLLQLTQIQPLKTLIIRESMFSPSAIQTFGNTKPDCQIVQRKVNPLWRETFDEN